MNTRDAGRWRCLAAVTLLLGTSGTGGAQGTTKAPQARAAAAEPATFDVVSIKPSAPNTEMQIQWKGTDFYRAQGVSLFTSVELAYFSVKGLLTHGTADRVLNAPDWLKHDLYDFVGKVAEADVATWQNQAPDLPLMQQMVRAALKDRCNLKAHLEMKDGPVYGLVPGKHAPVLKAADPDLPDPAGTVRLPNGGRMLPYRRREDPTVTFLDISMAEFAAFLSNSANRPVVEQTGLTGRYTFKLTLREASGAAATDPEMPSPYDLDKLGFKLLPVTASLQTLVIDHVEKPSEN